MKNLAEVWRRGVVSVCVSPCVCLHVCVLPFKWNQSSLKYCMWSVVCGLTVVGCAGKDYSLSSFSIGSPLRPASRLLAARDDMAFRVVKEALAM